MSRPRAVLGILVAALLVPCAVSAQNAVITGTVRSETQTSVRGAIVTIAALEVTAVTNDNGNYRLIVPADQVRGQTVTVAVTSIGYRDVSAELTLSPGDIQQNFQMTEEAVALDELIVTGTAGRQERRAQAAVVSTINAAKIAEVAPVTSVANLIQGRTPGVMMRQTVGSSGSGQTIRIRGVASIGLSSEPLIFIDGVRSDGGNEQNFGVGGGEGSQLNDLKMEDIENIEIVKGPAAATLYGSDASAGVINVITKRGRVQSGFTQSFTVEYGQADPNFTPPSNYARCPEDPPSSWTACQGQPEGTLLIDNPLVRENAFGDGRYRNLVYSVRGGGPNYGVFLSFGADDDQGTLPNNEYGHYSGRAAFDFVPSQQLRMEFGFWVGRTERQLPHNDNNIYGWLGGGYLGNPATRGGPNDGWYGANRTSLAIGSLETYDKSLRFQPRIAIQYTPFSWFSNRLMVGGDIQRVRSYQFWPKNPDRWFDSAPLNTGQIGERRDSEDRITIDYLGNVTWNATPDIRSDFSFGAQILTEAEDETFATGQGLVTNVVRNVSAAAVLSGGGQSFEESRQIGFFGQAQFSLWEKLYIQAGARLDQASVFGSDSDPFVSPKVGASYVLSDEPFFRNIFGESLITALKLRGAYGATGRQPDEGVLATYDTDPYAIQSGDVEVGVTPADPGNSDLRPERSAEFELGFDAGLFNDRLGIELTYFNKTTTDLVIEQDLPGSLGFGDDPVVNLGKVRNKGIEVGANARILTFDNFAWELFGSVSTVNNEILDLGDVDPGTGTTRDAEGGPIDAQYEYVVRRFDLENDRVIVSNDREFIGNDDNLPGWETTFSSTVTLFRNISMYAAFAGRGDYILNDGTTDFRDRSTGRSEIAVLGLDAPGVTEEEYRSKFGPFVTEDGETISRNTVDLGYKQNVEFLKLREVSASYRIPREFANRYMRAQTAQLTVAVRNLATWTNYRGADPETDQFLTVPQDRRWTLRMNVNF
jgi:TonB-linked SusC/RagA family outer membrane protein